MSQTVLAKLTCKPGTRAAVVEAFAPMLQHVQENEPGTLTYLLHEDVNDADVLWFYEVYADDESFKAHGSSDAMKAVGGALAGNLAGRPELIFLNAVGGKGA